MGLTRDFVRFTDKNGVEHRGKIVHSYGAYEGGMRYILKDESSGIEYRCVKKDGKFVELVV